MDRIDLTGQLDISRLDREWEPAGKDLRERYVRNARMRLGVVLICGVIVAAFVIAVLVSVINKDGSITNDDGANIGRMSALLIIYLVVLFFSIKRYLRDVSQNVYTKTVVLINAVRGKGKRLITFGECREDGSFCYVSRDFMREKAALRDDFECGDLVVVTKVGDDYSDIAGYVASDNILLKRVADTSMQKVDERSLVKGDDHRTVEFYIMQNDTGLRMIALTRRLDISDDMPVKKYDRYYIEDYDAEAIKNHKAFAGFADRIMTCVADDMELEK